ncbi:hypothetical protein J4422_01865 [Candidatus Pacearchaeota archaeon]|nr:hypothetical protein [Candidatus Pacearchaeota archaeon]
MVEGEISFKFKENWQDSKKWLYASLVLLLVVLILGTYIRTANISGLKDATTGNYTLGPDLDPFLYLRLAHEIIDTGSQPSVDSMRYLGMAEPYQNFLQWGIVYLYKFLKLFSSDVSLEYAAIIFPVIFFGLSIVVFFFFVREIFYKKEEFQKSLIGILATAVYAVVPLMQHRTTAGIPELESAGLFFFWLSFFFFLKAWHNEKKIFKINKSYLLALTAGISTILMIFTWGGFRFILYSLSLATLIAFFIGKVGKKETTVFFLWFIPAFLFLGIKSGFKVAALDVTYATIPLFVFLVLLVNIFIGEKIERKVKNIVKKEWITKEMVSFVLVVFVGLLVLLVIKPDFLIGIFKELIERLLYPFGRARIGLTVAENQQLYLTDIFSSFGKSFFWMFFFGLILLFSEAVKNLEKIEKRILITSFIIFLTGFIFSRYSPNSTVFNGESFISQLVYFGSLLIFVVSLIYIYIKNLKAEGKLEKLKNIEFSHLFLLSLTILMIVASRGAIRLLVISSPVFVISMAFLPIALLGHRIRAKDDILKLFLLILLLISLFYIGLTFKNYETATANGVKYTVPNQYSIQWQYAMSWVRDNTAENSIFVHWWDYGYWVQTIGQRPTVTDGGHAFGYWDHLTGRYLLTTTQPETALSLMKSYNVSYLLIDSTDLGKYSAYSIIGSDENGKDRFAQIPVMLYNPAQTRETNSSEIRVYQGSTFVDEDIVYQTNNDSQIFLPSGSAGVAGLFIEVLKSNNSISFKQPIGVFIYNNKQITIPIRYLQNENQILDFSSGLDSVIKIIPSVSQNAQGSIQVDRIGTAIYLSPKVSKSLFAQLYLLNDPSKKYETVKLAHSQPDIVLADLNSQGASIGEFAYFNGFRGPIKIWKTDYPENILYKEEFLRTSGEYADMDNFDFTK